MFLVCSNRKYRHTMIGIVEQTAPIPDRINCRRLCVVVLIHGLANDVDFRGVARNRQIDFPATQYEHQQIRAHGVSNVAAACDGAKNNRCVSAYRRQAKAEEGAAFGSASGNASSNDAACHVRPPSLLTSTRVIAAPCPLLAPTFSTTHVSSLRWTN